MCNNSLRPAAHWHFVHSNTPLESAKIDGLQALTLAKMLQDADDWIGDAPEILNLFEEKTRRKTLFSYVFF